MPEILVVGFATVAMVIALPVAFAWTRLRRLRRLERARWLLYSRRCRDFCHTAERLLDVLEQTSGSDGAAQQRLLCSARRQVEFLASRGILAHQLEAFVTELAELSFSFSRLHVMAEFDPRRARLCSLRSRLRRACGQALGDDGGAAGETGAALAPEDHQLPDEDSIFFASLTLAGVATGAAYLCVFVPLLWHTAREAHLDPLDTMLFAQVPRVVENLRGWSLLPLLGSKEALPFLYAYALTYGAAGFVLALLLRVAHRHSLATLVVVSNGLVWAYYTSIYCSSTVLNWIEMPQRTILWVKLVYVVLFFYVIDALKDLIPNKGLARKNYSTLLDGTYGIVSSLLIIKGFGERPAALLTGPLFLVCCFAMTFLAQQTLGRLVYAVIQFEKLDANMERLSPMAAARLLWRVWWKAVRSYHGQELAFSLHVPNMRSVWRCHRWEFVGATAATFAVFSLFPLAAFCVIWLLATHLPGAT